MQSKHRSDEQPRRSSYFDNLRQRMVQHQLRSRGIADERVFQAMGAVPREEFVSESERGTAYEDCPLPIGFGQTISQPYTVAFQCESLLLQGNERVLEIGTGSGYAAAVLSLLAKAVYTVERIPGLATQAQATVNRLGYSNVQVFVGDGTLGLPAHAPFDGIIVTAGGVELPKPFVEQLAMGGRIVIPLGDYRDEQYMYRFTKTPEGLQAENLGGFAFVPLVGRYGWDDSPFTHEPS